MSCFEGERQEKGGDGGGCGVNLVDFEAVSLGLHIKVPSAICFSSYLSMARITGCATTPSWSVICSSNTLVGIDLEDTKHGGKTTCMTQSSLPPRVIH